ISWSTDPGAASYNLYRATNAGGETTTPRWTGITGTSFVDATATPGVTYYYKVTAVDPESASPTDPPGESALSAEVSAAAQTGGSTSVNAPTGLLSTPQNGPQVQLAWTANSTAETGFNIVRATNLVFTENVTTFSVPATSQATATYTDMTVVPGNTY